MGDVIQESGDSTKPFGYCLFEEVMAALSLMRRTNSWGYQYEDDSNLPGQGPGNGVTNLGVLIPYVKATAGNSIFLMDPDGSGRTNCSCSTLNAFAVAVSHTAYSPPQAKDKRFRIPIIGRDIMPRDFYQRWQLADEADDDWPRGAARAIQKYNMGPRVKGTLVRRGDCIQLCWSPTNQGNGHSVFCYHARRISDTETRFLIASAQVDTFGIGVRMNRLDLEVLLQGESAEAASPEVRVDHPEKIAGGDLESPEHVQRNLRHGHWFIARDLDDKGAAKCPVKQAWGGFDRAWVARPARPFPCFPISLAGKRSLALLDTDHATAKATSKHAGGIRGAQEHAHTEQSLLELYYANTELGSGGFFPISASRSWHGGIHLHPANDPTVYAAFDGRVVCARLAPRDPKWKDTSPNFVLLKHALEIQGSKKEFWTLSMHLKQIEAPENGPDPRLVFPWLRDLLLAPEDGTPEAGLSDSDGWKKIYLKVKKVSASNPPKLGDKPLAAGDVLAFDPANAHAVGIWLGRIAQTTVGDRPDCERVLSTDPSGKLVKGDGAKGKFNRNLFQKGWLESYDAYPSKLAKKKKDLLEGKVVDLWDEGIVVGAGEPIGFMGELEGSSTLHFELFSESLISCWTDKATVKEDDAKLFVDRKKFTDRFFELLDQGMEELKGIGNHMVDGPAKKEDKMLTRDEIVTFFNENPDAKKFRDIVSCHPSEWSEAAKLDTFDTGAKKVLGFLTDSVLKDHKDWVKNYVFWDKSLKSKGLPSSMTVYHYHPIRFIEWIDGLRETEAQGGQGAKLHESVFELNHKVGS